MVGIMAALGVAALVAGCNSGEDQPLLPHQVVSASGDVAGAVAQFRGLLGDPLNGATPGSQAAGRREINWDGVPASFTDNDALPVTSSTRARRAGRSSRAPAFRVSDRNLAEVDPSYAGQFTFFSPQKTFAVAGSAVMETEFQVPGRRRHPRRCVASGWFSWTWTARARPISSSSGRAEAWAASTRPCNPRVAHSPSSVSFPGHRGDPRPHRLGQRCPR
jgi:hypothetical protein